MRFPLSWPFHFLIVFTSLNVCLLLIWSEDLGWARKLSQDQTRPQPVVLTLKEASRLLRVEEAVVAKLAREGIIPGRLIGGHWRFSQQALLKWLAKEDAGGNTPEACSSPLKKPTSEPTQGSNVTGSSDPGSRLPASVLPHIAGRGTAPSGEKKPGSQENPETIGEKPDLPTADEVFLRQQQVLLKPSQMTLELGVFYTKSEQQGLTILPTNFGPFIAFSQAEEDVFTSVYTARYGLPYDIQFFSTLPLLHRKRTFTASIPGTNEQDQTSSSLTETGSLRTGFRHTLIKEGFGYPDVVVSVSGIIPTRKSSYGIEGGFSLLKRFDPGVLFANFNYQHTFSREFMEFDRLQPENVFTGGFGYALSINDTLAISTSVIGVFTTQTTFDNPALPKLPAEERFSLRLALTALITERLYAEPEVIFSLNGPSTVTVGLTLPYTFTTPSLEQLFSSTPSISPPSTTN